MAARDYRIPIDLHGNELRSALAHLLASAPGTPVEGLFYWNTTTHVVEFYNGTAWLSFGTLDQLTAPAADVSLNSHKITALANGTASTDAVNKSQLDAALAGLSWKAAVRAATTANGTLATAFENGDTIDGVTLATGDRILLKNQSAPAENGIYVVAASGAPARSSDADSGGELLNSAVFVEEGTTNADTGWVCTTNAPITPGSTSLAFVQFTGAGISAGTGITVVGSTVSIDHAVVPEIFAADIGDGVTTSIVVTHNLGTRDVNVAVYDKTTPFSEQYPEVRRTTTNTVTLVFSVAPTASQFRCVVLG